jgi:hypothetical protein
VVCKLKEERVAQGKERELRSQTKSTLKAALVDGSLQAAATPVRHEKEEPNLENMRQLLKATFQKAVVDDSLSSVIRTVKEDKVAREKESARKLIRCTFEKSVSDGRLLEVFSAVKKEKADVMEARDIDLRRQAKHSIKKAFFDGRLFNAVSTIEEEERQEELCLVNEQPAPQKNDSARQLLKTTLENSFLDGRLEEALASVKREKQISREAEEMKSWQQTTENLQATFLDGRLFEAASQAEEESQQQELETLRKQLKQTFASAIADGRLSEVVSSLKEERANRVHKQPSLTFQTQDLENHMSTEASQESRVASTCQSIRNTLEASLMDGRLEEVLSSMKKRKAHAKLQEIEKVRQQTCKTLQMAILDGRLLEAVSAVKAEKVRKRGEAICNQSKSTQAAVADGHGKEKELEELSRRTESTSQTVVMDGRHNSPPSAAKSQKTPDSIESMRHKLKQTLVHSFMDGHFEEAMASVKDTSTIAAVIPNVETLRQKARETFEAAVSDGRLQEAVSEIKQERNEQEVEKMRRQLKATFQAAITDGRFKSVVYTVKEERAARENESTRKLIRCTLEKSMADGSLLKALASVKKGKGDAIEAEQKEPHRQANDTVKDTIVDGRPSDAAATTEEKAVPTKPIVAKPTVRPTRHNAALKTASKTCVFNMDAARDQDVAFGSSARDSSLVRTYDALESRLPMPPATKAQARRLTPKRKPQPQAFSMDEEHTSSRVGTPTVLARDSSLARSYDALTNRHVDSWTWSVPHANGCSRPASPKGGLPPVAPPSKRQMSLALPPVARPCSKLSAMSLDLGDYPTTLNRPTRLEQNRDAHDNFIGLSLATGTDLAVALSGKPSSVRSLSPKRSGLLPPILGNTKRSMSRELAAHNGQAMDAFVWGVAPVRYDAVL